MGDMNPTLKAPHKVYVVRITFDPATQELNTTGPLDNGILFLGMLEMAKVAYHKTALAGALPTAGVVELPRV